MLFVGTGPAARAGNNYNRLVARVTSGDEEYERERENEEKRVRERGRTRIMHENDKYFFPRWPLRRQINGGEGRNVYNAQ